MTQFRFNSAYHYGRFLCFCKVDTGACGWMAKMGNENPKSGIPFFWIKGPPNGGTVFNNGVVYFNRIALLFFISFFLSSFLPFFFFAGTKAEAFHCPSWPSSALIFDQNRAVFWPRSSTNLQHFFTTSRKEINLEKFVFLIYDIRSCLLKNSNALFGNHAQDLLRWKFGREPDDFGTEWWFSMMSP